MGRPLNNTYFFSGSAKLDPKEVCLQNFEIVKAHACYNDGEEVQDAEVVKQTGYNKYLVKNGEGKEVIIRLVDDDKEKADKEGLGYINVYDVDNSEHKIEKMVKNRITTFDGLNLIYSYDLVDDKDCGLSGAFCMEMAHPEVMSDLTIEEEHEVVTEKPEVIVSKKSKKSKKAEEVVEETPSEEVVEEPKAEETPSEEVAEETPSEEVVEENK